MRGRGLMTVALASRSPARCWSVRVRSMQRLIRKTLPPRPESNRFTNLRARGERRMGVGDCPRCPEFLIDYVHSRYGLSAGRTTGLPKKD